MHKATQRFVSGHNSLGRIFKFSEQALTRLKEQRKNDKTYGERMKKINAEKKGKTWEQLYGIDGAKRLKEDAAKRRLGTKHSNETKHKMTITKIGNKNPMHGMSGTLSPVWNGGTSFFSYGPEFSFQLRKEIRDRDSHTCQLCGTHESECDTKLHVHHIDYNKKNCSEVNLISLCRTCHIPTKTNRQYWEEYFTNLIISKIN